MNLSSVLTKRDVKDVTLYGEAALYLNYGLPGMPTRIDYTAPSDILKDIEGKRLIDEGYKVPYKYRVLKGNEGVLYTCSLDTVCFAIHMVDINTVVEYILCNLDDFDSNAVRKRYAELYACLSGMPGTSMRDCSCTMAIETWCKNIRKSNIVAYMRKQNLSYAKFCQRTPSLCAQLNCSEQDLNYAIKELL